MNAQKALITNIFNGATLIEVPFFQRPYVWNDELWAKFIEDMEFIVLTHKTHFLGAIILKDAGQPKPGDKVAQHHTIVDGQQRLTTFLLFLKALCLKQNQMTFFDFQFRIMGQEIALRHGKNDRDAFEKAISTTTTAKIENPEPGSRIIEAFNYFLDHVDASKLNIIDKEYPLDLIIEKARCILSSGKYSFNVPNYIPKRKFQLNPVCSNCGRPMKAVYKGEQIQYKCICGKVSPIVAIVD